MSVRRLIGSRRMIVVAVLFVAVLSGPAAMAVGGCATMAMTSDELCSLTSYEVPITTRVAATPSIAWLVVRPPSRAPIPVLTVPELPPKSAHSSA